MHTKILAYLFIFFRSNNQMTKSLFRPKKFENGATPTEAFKLHNSFVKLVTEIEMSKNVEKY